ncbi:hypothetical protein ACSL9C_001030 [Vibrio navarrensis]|jgi:hypothetical protein|nr:hypothetical protein [Vibrio navarrensis]
MNISYRVELTCEEIAELNELTSKGKHNARKLKRAQILYWQISGNIQTLK